MYTVEEVLQIQKQDNILHTPAPTSTKGTLAGASASGSSALGATATINVVNNTSSNNVYVYVTGLDTSNNSAVWMLESDGTSSYYPANPSADGTALSADVAIAVGAAGSSRTITVPYLTGARVWFSQDAELTFTLNPGSNGPALVEPSVTNPSDVNYSIKWDFCEFSYSSYQIFVNLSHVDFFSIPVALELTSSDGSATQTVLGLPADGLTTVCEALQAQQAVDCAGWDSLVVQVASNGVTEYLRALSPNSAITLNSSLFTDYYDAYVDAVWTKYTSSALTIDTQGSWGQVTGQVDAGSGELSFGSLGSFAKPTAANIFNCSNGPFYTSDDEIGNISARLAAAFNRSTLLVSADQPDGTSVLDFYQTSPTNHYSRILHATSLDGRGYAFPYDDVTPTNATDQSGSVASASPGTLTISIGGSSTATRRTTNTHTSPILLREMARPGRQLVGGRGHNRRSLPEEPTQTKTVDDAVNEKALLMVREAMAPFYRDEARPATFGPHDFEKIDLERGSAGLAPAGRRSRLVLLLQLLLLHLWAAVATVGRGLWALVPRAVAVPVAKTCTAIAAAPAVKATVSGVASVASSAAVRSLLVRGAVSATLVLVYLAAGASPLVAALVTTLAGKEAGPAPADIGVTPP